MTTSAVPDPEPIIRTACGFMAAKHLYAANELGLFECLADGPADLDTLAARTGLTPRAARISADAMVALGLLDHDAQGYRNTPATQFYLAGKTPADLRPFLRFWDRLSYRTWEGLAQALSKGPSSQITELDEEDQRIASAGIQAITTGAALALAQGDELSGRDRLLDIGGGTGFWSMAVVGAQPQLSATVAELPMVAAIARESVAAAGLADRVAVVSVDARTDPLPAGHDACLLANVIHYFSPEENRALLTRVRDVVEHGALLLVADFWTDPTHTQPLMAALMAGEFAVNLHHGDVYSVDEARAWLEATGWRFTGHRVLAGPLSVVTAEAA
ncbi:methyltransferase [Streptacidiphilus jiangxiensis]|uniref:Dimerisation domain-containing protein n=1 Tax=Streptacidiphilus jiangxiensis TaxID=235985 RepID=A0A1H7YM25_STRJI|nr:methyltransferase [Streptacidiphilus jiangxiensis]SEM46219.1 Dimerisation domain-containing protein [Streptacidiphilus jiangxiensis]